MLRKVLLPLACLLLASIQGTAADLDAWGRMRTGMTAFDTATLLGAPLIRTTGHGFDMWIYDSCAEVLFYRGPVIAWTAPVSNPESEARPIENDMSFRPAVPAPRVNTRKVPMNGVGDYPPDTRFRYRRRR